MIAMSLLSRALSFFTVVILRSIFLYGYSELRKGTILLSLMHLTIVLTYGLKYGPSLLAYTAPISILYLVLGMYGLLIYSLAVSSIPGLWMSLTQLIMDVLKGMLNPLNYISIYVKSTLTSLAILYVLHTLNPSELSTLLYRARKSLGMYPQLFMRINSFLIKEGIEAIYTHSLKGESVWKTLAILMLRGDELTRGFSEGLMPKYMRFKPSLIYSARTIWIQLLILGYDIILVLLITTSWIPQYL